MITRFGAAALVLFIAGATAAASAEATPVPKVELATRLKLEVEWPGSPAAREALVMLQFDVLANGKVANITLADGGFHTKAFVYAATEALKKSTWQPKRIDGKPVDTIGRMLAIRFSLDDMEPGITAEFRDELVEVINLLKKGDLAGGHFHAEWMLSDVVKLNYEYAVLQAQLAETYANLGKISEASSRAWRATVRPSAPLPEYFQLQTTVPANNASNYLLPKELIVNLLRLRMRLGVKQGLFADAMQSYYELAGLVELPPTDPVAVQASELTALIRGNGNLVGSFDLRDWGTGRHYLTRHRFSVEKVQGSLKTIEVKCSAGSQAYDYKPGLEGKVPSEWGACIALFEAEPGTTFDFVEYPDPRAPEPAL